MNDIVKLPVREQIGRYKYTKEDHLAAEYEKVTRRSLQQRLRNFWERRTCKMPKEYRTIQEVAGPFDAGTRR